MSVNCPRGQAVHMMLQPMVNKLQPTATMPVVNKLQPMVNPPHQQSLVYPTQLTSYHLRQQHQAVAAAGQGHQQQQPAHQQVLVGGGGGGGAAGMDGPLTAVARKQVLLMLNWL